MPTTDHSRMDPHEIRKHLPELLDGLTEEYRPRLERLLALDWEPPEYQVQVALVQTRVLRRPTLDARDRKAIDGANRALSRLLQEINGVAEKKRLPLRIRASSSKQGGAANRYVWFTAQKWGYTPPANQGTKADQPTITDQQGLPISKDDKPSRSPVPPRHRLSDREGIEDDRYINDQQGNKARLRKESDPLGREAPAVDPEPVGALDYLLTWVDAPQAPPLFALLGEYGMGKTVTCQDLKRRLDLRRDRDPGARSAMYFDLRLVTGLDRRVPTLKEVCEECVTRGWGGSAATGAYQIEDVLDWAAAGAVAIFDGLDEVLVKLDGKDGQAFTRTLLGMATLVRERNGDQGRPARLLISCRTHYFRTLRDQQTHFTDQERADPQADGFRALVLLPFTEAQVRRYLAAALGSRSAAPGSAVAGQIGAADGGEAVLERLFETIRSVHNLTELTRRPYTLRLVAEFIPAIEVHRLKGEPVYGVTLYRELANRWLDRDHLKHRIQPDHKRRLAAHLAAHLWRSGGGLLPADRLEAWFFGWLEGEPDLRPRYARLSPDQLEEDLRTATFLVRQDAAEGGGFRFAHTSLLEYFLAEYLIAAIRAAAPERWDLPTPSRETLDFLGQLLAEAGHRPEGAQLLATLQGWRLPYRPRVCELLLDYGLRALEKGWPSPSLRGLALTGAELSDRVLRGPPGGPLLDLSDADLSGAVLRRVVFERVRLSGACLRDATMTQASLLDCEATQTDWSGASCDGAVWRCTDLTGARWDVTRGRRAQFIRCLEAPETIAGMASRSVPAARPHPAPDWCARPPLRLLTGHQGEIAACAFAPDGTRLLSAGEDGTLHLWNADSGTPLLTCQGHQGGVAACAFAPDGARLLSAGRDGTLCLWDAASGSLLTRQNHQGGIIACAFSPNGSNVLFAGSDGVLRLWDAASGSLLIYEGHQGRILACAFSPNDSRLLSAGSDGTLRLWNVAAGAHPLTYLDHRPQVTTRSFSFESIGLISPGDDGARRLWDAAAGAPLLTYQDHQGRVTACTFSPDRTCALSADDAPTLRLWGAASALPLITCQGHQGEVRVCAFSPDGTQLLSAGEDGTLRLWDAASGTQLRTWQDHQGGAAACAFAPDGARLLTAGTDGTLRLWDAASGALLLTWQGHQGRVRACAFAPDGARLISAGKDGTLRLWDAASGNALLTCQGEQESEVWTKCAFSPDGARLLSAGKDGILRLWDAASGNALLTCRDSRGEVSGCAISPDGTRLLSTGGWWLCLRDAATGRLLWYALHGLNSTAPCAFSPDGTRVLSWGFSTTLLRDAASEEKILTLCSGWGPDNKLSACAFSTDGDRLLSAHRNGKLQLWDSASGEHLLTCQGSQDAIWACTFAPDGTRLLAVGENGTLRLWDAASGTLLLTCQGHQGEVLACAFDPEGARLLSAGADGALRLWDAASGAALLTCQGHQGTVLACAFTPDGTRLLSAGDDGTLRLWDAATGDCLRIHAVQTAPWPGHAVWEPPTNRLIEWSGAAWRWLHWVTTDVDGWPDPLPLETFGDLPTPER